MSIIQNECIFETPDPKKTYEWIPNYSAKNMSLLMKWIFLSHEHPALVDKIKYNILANKLKENSIIADIKNTIKQHHIFAIGTKYILEHIEKYPYLINHKNSTGHTALWCTLFIKNWLEIAKILINADCDLNIIVDDETFLQVLLYEINIDDYYYSDSDYSDYSDADYSDSNSSDIKRTKEDVMEIIKLMLLRGYILSKIELRIIYRAFGIKFIINHIISKNIKYDDMDNILGKMAIRSHNHKNIIKLLNSGYKYDKYELLKYAFHKKLGRTITETIINS